MGFAGRGANSGWFNIPVYMASWKKIGLIIVVAFFVAAVVSSWMRAVVISGYPETERGTFALFWDLIKKKIAGY